MDYVYILSVDPFIDCDYIVTQWLPSMRCFVTHWHTIVLDAAIPYHVNGDYLLIGGPDAAHVMTISLTAGIMLDLLGGIDSFSAENGHQRYRNAIHILICTQI